MAIRWSKRLFTPVALGFMIYLAYQHRETLVGQIRHADIGRLALGVVIWSLLYLLSGVFLRCLLKPLGKWPGYLNAVFISVNRLPARYIPGGIWHTIARAIDLGEYGIEKRILWALFIMENALAVAMAILIGGMLLILFGGQASFVYLVGGMMVAAFAGLILLRRFINRYVLDAGQEVGLGSYLQLLAVIGVYWIGASSVFVLYVTAFPDISSEINLLRTAGVYLFSWGIGFLAFFAPQGLGVFEYMAGQLMHSQQGLASIMILVAGFRLVVFAADVLAWVVMRVYARHQ